MADLEWGLTDEGVQAFGDEPEEALSFARHNIGILTVNGVPLADVLAEIAAGLDDDPHGVGVDLRDYAMSVAVLRALAEIGEGESE